MLGMNTVSSMIWLRMLSRVRVVMSGLARIMMVMYKVISWLKVSTFLSSFIT